MVTLTRKILEKESFGLMSRNQFPSFAGRSFEVMHFTQPDKSHTHTYDEYAICVSGKGRVMVGENAHRIEAGDLVVIPANEPHFMIPDGDQPLQMVICYQTVA